MSNSSSVSKDYESLLPWFNDVIEFLQDDRMASWGKIIEQQLHLILHEKEHGDQKRWLAALSQLPVIDQVATDFTHDTVTVSSATISKDQQQETEQALRGLMPWRKGPFQFFDTLIDTEWRSDWKWQRVAPHLSSLKDRVILDVGCGSGYHLWRMLGAGAYRVIGIDPSRLFLMQFQAVKCYAEASGQFPDGVRADLLPLKMEDVPPRLKAFDTTFSMGVLYHRRSPIDHLQELRDTLKPGGELVLETLIVDGPEGYSLMPKDRYAMMRNVWFLPSVDTLKFWCERVGLTNIKVVDINQTSIAEQRSTDWMRYNSLVDFLDPNDHDKTAEGYPAPKRVVLIATA